MPPAALPRALHEECLPYAGSQQRQMVAAASSPPSRRRRSSQVTLSAASKEWRAVADRLRVRCPELAAEECAFASCAWRGSSHRALRSGTTQTGDPSAVFWLTECVLCRKFDANPPTFPPTDVPAPPLVIDLIGRSGEIRTPDPLLPKQVRYQAALRSARPSR